MRTRARGLHVVALGLAMLAVGCTKPNAEGTADAGRPADVAVHVRPAPAPGELPVDVQRSKITLAIIKDRDAKSPVIATLLLRDGAVRLGPGTARLTLDLDTFDSGIPLRNERVRGIVFETSGVGWDTAELTVEKIPDDALAALREKKLFRTKLDATLKLHGHTAKLVLPVEASFASGGELWVKTSEPLVLKTSDFDLIANVKRLSQICMHDSVDDAVSVEVSLTFH